MPAFCFKIHFLLKSFLLFVFFAFFVNPVFSQSRNVILITIDTLRADYLSYNGSIKVQTPNLDHLAKEGANFTRARTSVPLTLPSHTSILTGLYPPSHGVRDNGTYRLDKDQITLAEVMKKHDYATAAFVGSFVLDHRFGLDQGFDVYDDHMQSGPSQMENLEAERNAAAVFASFNSWLNSYRGDKPLFVWIHLYDPHTPYTPPEPFLTKYSGNHYAGEVAYTDSVVGKVVQTLEARKILNNSIIAVVGDHGEGLGEHEERTHSVLIYNSTLHVPMIVFAPGLIQAGINVSSLSRTIDLAPTLLDYAGFTEKFGEGVSLRSKIEKKETAEITAYSESLYPRLNLGWSELHGLESDQYHFILAPSPELYDVQKDPEEVKNQIQQQPNVAKQLQQQLKGFTTGTSPSPAAQMDEETKEKLSSLGYVSGSTPSKTTNIDPKDKMAVWNEIQVGLSEFKDGNYAAAVRDFEKLRISNDEILLIYDYLGSCYMSMQQWSNAQKVYSEALKRGYDSSLIRTNLGISYYQIKQFDRAQQELEKAVALDVVNVSAQYRLGDVLRTRGDLEKAAEHYQRALEINPRFFYAANGLGMTYAAMKKDEDALRYFQKSVEMAPENALGYFNLAVQLDHMGRSRMLLLRIPSSCHSPPEVNLIRNGESRLQQSKTPTIGRGTHCLPK